MQQDFSCIPRHAGIRDALTINQWFARFRILTTGNKMAFQHQTDNPLIASSDLGRNVTTDNFLLNVILVAVGMTAINHYPDWLPRAFDNFSCLVDTAGIVVGFTATT